MKKYVLPLLLLLSLSVTAQKKDGRLFINLGAGPSYSLFYSSGGWVRDFGSPNTQNITQSRDAWAFSHFGELEWRLKNRRWSLRGGYSMHHFFPKFHAEGTSPSNAYYNFDTQEADRYLYLQATAHYALLQSGRSRLEIGTGFYIQKNHRQNIEHYSLYQTPTGTGSAFLILDYDAEEAGFPFNLDYSWALNSGSSIGARFNMNYTQSVQTFEHLALQFFVKARLH